MRAHTNTRRHLQQLTEMRNYEHKIRAVNNASGGPHRGPMVLLILIEIYKHVKEGE